MILSKNKVVLTPEESKKVIELFSKYFDENTLRLSAKQIGFNKLMSTVYFDDIYKNFPIGELRNVTRLEFSDDVGSKQEKANINKIFKTVNTINRWANFPEDMLRYEYFYRLLAPIIGVIIGFAGCTFLYVQRVILGAQVIPALFDMTMIITILFLLNTVTTYWVYRRKLAKLAER